MSIGSIVSLVLGIAVGLLIVQLFYQYLKYSANNSKVSGAVKGSDDLLKESGIPRPEFLLVNMLALKIASAPEADIGYSDGVIHVEITGGKVAIHYGRWEGRCNSVRVAIHNGDTSRNCILRPDEVKVLITAIDDLADRTKKLRTERAEQESSNASLDALTSLVGG